VNRQQMVEKAARAFDATPTETYDMTHEDMAVTVLDAILPQVTTATKLEALPVGAVVVDGRGEAWKNRSDIDGKWYGTDLDECKPARLVRLYGPLTVVWMPEATA
jgi:hypothetical protein